MMLGFRTLSLDARAVKSSRDELSRTQYVGFCFGFRAWGEELQRRSTSACTLDTVYLLLIRVLVLILDTCIYSLDP